MVVHCPLITGTWCSAFFAGDPEMYPQLVDFTTTADAMVLFFSINFFFGLAWFWFGFNSFRFVLVFVTCRSVSSFRFLSFLRHVSLRFILFRFVSFRYVSFGFVSFCSVSLLRFVFVSFLFRFRFVFFGQSRTYSAVNAEEILQLERMEYETKGYGCFNRPLVPRWLAVILASEFPLR